MLLSGWTIDGEETIAGQHAVRLVGDDPNPLIRWLVWKLPVFGCETVQQTLERRAKIGDDWQVSSGSHLVKFAEIDPDPALFSGFASYSEMAPSALVKQFSLRNSETAPKACPGCAVADQNYKDWNK